MERDHPGLLVRCAICKYLVRVVNTRHLKPHGITQAGYRNLYPDEPLYGAVLKVCMFCGRPAKFINAKLCGVIECNRKYDRKYGIRSDDRERLRLYGAETDWVECLLCNRLFQMISGMHLLERHGVSDDEYMAMFPGASLITDSSRLRHSAARQSWMQHLDYHGRTPDDRLIQGLTGGLLGDGGLEAVSNFALSQIGVLRCQG